MNIQQTLERLAVVAGDWIEHYPEVSEFLIAGTLRVGEAKSGALIEVMPGYGRDARWDIFGAICEKCEAEGWAIAAEIKPFDYVPEPYQVSLWLPDNTDYWEAKYTSKENLATAAAKALLAALKAKLPDCTECRGSGKYRRWHNKKPIITDCPKCHGSGKQKPTEATHA